MIKYTDAFMELLSDAENCTPVELLMRYSAAKVIWEDITVLLGEDEYDYLEKDNTSVTKLRLALTLFRQAAVSDLDGPSNAAAKIRSSRDNLNKFVGAIRP
jgi:hypothetical protein